MRRPRVPTLEQLRREYDCGFADGRAGVDRAHGSDSYRQGYDDGLDQYDCDHAAEEGWDASHCA